MAKKGGYLDLGLSKIVNIILAIIFPVSFILGGITRIMRGHLISGILQLLLIGEIVFFFLDLFTLITQDDLTFFA